MEDTYYLKLAYEASKKSTCLRRQVGAIAVDDNGTVWGSGFNGAPECLPKCTPELCIRMRDNIPSGQNLDLCRAIHAEQRLLNNYGITLNYCSIYVTNQPCSTCFKLLMQAGIKRIVWSEAYNDNFTLELMKQCGNIIVGEHFTEFLKGDNHAVS